MAHMSEEQKFTFDLKGWILLPEVIDRSLATEIRSHVESVVWKPETLPAAHRSTYSGPAEVLLDHPSVVGILGDVLQSPDPAPDCYGFRCENSFAMYRNAGADGLVAHGGGPTLNPHFNYQVHGGQIFSGLTRIIWELNDVNEGDGSTLIMSGSHKSAFAVPKSLSHKDSPLFESYSCPAGSAIIFSEALCHAGPVWNNQNYPRVGVFNCYNRVDQQWHKLNATPEAINSLSPKRQTLFRGVWGWTPPPGPPNNYFNDTNKSI